MLLVTGKSILTTTNTLTVILNYIDFFNHNCSGNTKQITKIAKYIFLELTPVNMLGILLFVLPFYYPVTKSTSAYPYC